MLDEDADTTDLRDDVTETDDKETTKESVTATKTLVIAAGRVIQHRLRCCDISVVNSVSWKKLTYIGYG